MTDSDQQLIQREADNERILLGGVHQSRVRVKNVGKLVTIRGGTYEDVNFFIRQSRKYFPHCRLRTFLCFYLMPFVYTALVFPGSLLGFHFSTALILSQLHLCFFLVYCQHMHVIVWTMPYVMLQVTRPDHTMRNANEHKEIDIDVYRTKYAATSRAGIGLTTHESGKIELQIFSKSAKDQMNRAIIMSLGGLLVAFLMWVVFTTVGVALLV